MLKRFFFVVVEIVIGVTGNLIAGWIQQDIWTNFFSPTRVLGSFVSITILALILSTLENDNDNRFNWYWHRFWYLYNLVYNPKLNHWRLDYAQLDISEIQRKRLTVDVVVAGERQNLLDLLSSCISDNGNNATRILVLGEPGSGKTTALERLILQTARQSLKHLGLRSKIPVLIRLGDFQNPELFSFIEQSISREVQGTSASILGGHVKSLLQKGRLILLIDALDEALGETREEVIKGLRVFASSQEYKHTPIIITARTHQDPRDGLPDFQIYEIQDLDDEAVNTFIDVYKDPLSISDFVRQEIEEIGVLGLNGLGRNPFWLRLIITSGIVEPIQSILVDKAVDSLLEREWDKPETSRSWRRLFPREEQLYVTKEALAFFAYSMNLSKELSSTRILAEKTLTSWLVDKPVGQELKPRDILGLGRDAQILIYRIDPIRFRHRIIQEFLTAYSMTLNDPIETLMIIEEHIYDTDWWTTLQLFSGIAPDPKKLVDSILNDTREPIRLLLALIILFNLNNNRYADIGKTFLLEYQKIALREEKDNLLTKMQKIVGDVTRIFLKLAETNDEFVWRGAIALLGDLRNPGAINYLVLLLGNARLREDIWKALVQIGEPSIPYLIKQLTKDNDELCYGAATALGKFGDLAVDPLVDFLFQTKAITPHQYKINQLRTVEELWTEALIAEEIQETFNQGPYWAIRALGKTQSRLVIDILLNILHNGDNRARQGVSEALSDLQSDVAGQRLIAELQDPDEYVRRVVIQAIGDSGYSHADDAIMAATRDSDPLVRAAAINVLTKIGDNKVVPLLIPMLQDAFLPVRTAAIDAINSLADDPFSTLINIFNSYSNTSDAYQIANAIASTHLMSVKSFLNTACRNPDPNIRLRTIIILRTMEASDSIEYITLLIKDEDFSVQIAAVEILYIESQKHRLHFSSIYDNYIYSILGNLLNLSRHADKEIRNESISIISKMRQNIVIDPLINFFKTADTSMRLRLFESLCWRNDPRIKSFIREHLSDSNESISNLAIETIGMIGDSTDTTTLQNLRARSRDQRDAIGIALKLLKDREGDDKNN